MSINRPAVSLGDLASAGVPMHQAEAVAIAREAILRRARGEFPGIPAAKSLRLCSDGTVAVGEPIPVGSDLERAAGLLEALLTHSTPDASAPAALRLILARAYASDAAAFASLDEFAAALMPFAASDPAAVVRSLVATCPTGIVVEGNPVPRTEPVAPALPVTLRPSLDRRRRHNPSDAAAYEPPNRALWIATAAASVIFVVLLGAQWVSRDQSVVGGGDPIASTSPTAAPNTTLADVPDATAVESPPSSERHARATSVPAAPLSRSMRVAAAASRTESEVSNAAFMPASTTGTAAIFSASGTAPDTASMRADAGPDGGVLRIMNVVADRGSNFHPRPSPDGKRIAFDSDRDGDRGIYIANADGSGVLRISGDGLAAMPSWSPDGGRIAFVRAEPGQPRVWNVWTVEVESGVTTRVTNHSVGLPLGATWFPDGERIAYGQEDRLIIKPLGATQEVTFNSPVRQRLVRMPSVSPDGTKIMFQVHRDGVWMLDLADNSMRRILDDPSAEEFTWSPDGRRVAYHSQRAGEWRLWMMAPR